MPTQKTGTARAVLCYSLCFALLWAVLRLVLMPGKSLVMAADANAQHYPALVYYGAWLRRALTQGPELWSFRLGYGADVLTTLHYYGLGEPLTLLSALVPPTGTELLYGALICLRLYLAGLCALWYGRSRGLSARAAVIMALCWIGSGYAMGPGIFHPFFALPLLFLPLLLLGVDRALEQGTFGLFTLGVFLAAVSNFYFFYMLAIFTALYALARLLRSRGGIAAFGKGVFVLFVHAAAGCLAAGAVLLPNVLAILGSDRLGAARERLWLYPADYYQTLAAAFLTNGSSYYAYAAVSAVGILGSFVILAAPSRRFRWEKGLLALGLVMLLLPWFGSLLNGGSYATNRWIWALTFVLCWCAGRAMDELPNLTRAWRLRVVLLAGVLTLLVLLGGAQGAYLLPLALIWVGVGLLVLWSQQPGASALANALAVLAVVGIAANLWLWYADRGEDRAARFLPAGQALSAHSRWDLELLAQQDADLCRHADQVNGQHQNDALLYDVCGLDYYFSTIDAGTSAFQRSQWLNTPMGQSYAGVDRRTVLQWVLGARTQTAPQDGSAAWGYDEILGHADQQILSATKYALPLAWVYDTVTPLGQAADVLDRQAALLQTGLVDRRVDLPEAQIQTSWRELAYAVGDETHDAVLTQHTIEAASDNALLALTFPPVEDGEELYLLLEGLGYDGPDRTVTTVPIYLRADRSRNTLTYLTPADAFYCGYHDFLVNLSTQMERRETLYLSLPHRGTYTFQSLRLAAQPLGQMPERAAALQNSGVTQIRRTRQGVELSLKRQKAGLLTLSVPYSRGWSAWVDGTKTALLPVAGGLCGLVVKGGAHEIRLCYRTPGLSAGLCASALGLLLWLGLGLISRKKKTPAPSGAGGQSKLKEGRL